MQNNPFDFFERIYCVNLPECADRWDLVSVEFEQQGLLDRVERIYAPKPTKSTYFLPNMHKSGEMGCTMSHLKALGNAMDSTGPVLIFEDDVKFSDKCTHTLQTALNNIPDNWDLLYMGCQPTKQLTPVHDDVVFTANHMFGTYGYAVNAHSIRKLFNFMVDAIVTDKPHNGLCDVILGNFSDQHACFSVHPLIVTPVPNFSVVGNCRINPTQNIKNRWKKFANVGDGVIT